MLCDKMDEKVKKKKKKHLLVSASGITNMQEKKKIADANSNKPARTRLREE